MDGFVPWTEYAHPDFPHRKVEIGGFKPQWRANPPVAELDRLADEQLSFVVELAKLFPRLELARPRIEALGKQLFRVELELTNLGYLPTSTEFGASGRMTHPVQIELKLPAEVKLLHDSPRSRERRIPGNGAVQRSWILQSHGEGAPKITVRAGCPMTGYTEREFELKAPE